MGHRFSTLLLLGLACGDALPEELVLDGPARVRVDALGPVQGPSAALPDGTRPEGVIWTAEPQKVARVDDGVVRAVGPGEARITGEWRGRTVSWSLVVEPQITLVVVDPPGTIRVGEAVPLEVEGRIAGEVSPAGRLHWSTSAPQVALIDEDGTVRGQAPGITYVTVSSGRSRAMVELEVVAAGR